MPDKKPGGCTGKGFVKGDPRIYHGGSRPRPDTLMREVARKILNQRCSVVRDGKPTSMKRLEALILAQVNQAIKGDTAAATWVRDTAGFKPTTLLGNDPENPLLTSGSFAEFAVKMNGAVIPRTESAKAQEPSH